MTIRMSPDARMRTLERTEPHGMTENAHSPLFALVPPGLFGPLASPNREHYWQILCRLFEEFFGPDAPVPPSHGLPRREVTAAIERFMRGEPMASAEIVIPAPDFTPALPPAATP